MSASTSLKMTTSQLEAMLGEAAESSLNLSRRDCSEVEAAVLARAVLEPGLLDVELRDINIGKGQWETVFTKVALAPGGRKMFMLDLSENDLSGVHSKIMAKAICKLDHVDISDTNISMEQAETLFKEILENDVTIRSLSIDEKVCKKRNHKLALDVAEKIELEKEESIDAIRSMTRGHMDQEYAAQLKVINIEKEFNLLNLEEDKKDESVEAPETMKCKLNDVVENQKNDAEENSKEEYSHDDFADDTGDGPTYNKHVPDLVPAAQDYTAQIKMIHGDDEHTNQL